MTQIDFDHIRWPLCGTQLKAAPWNWHGNEFAFLLLARFELYVPHAPPLSFSDTPRSLSVALFSIHFPPLFSHSHSPGVYGRRVNFNSLAQSSGVQIGNPAVFAWRARVSERVNPFAKNAHPPYMACRFVSLTNILQWAAAGQRVGERRVIKRQFRFAPFCAWATVDEYLKLQISSPALKPSALFPPRRCGRRIKQNSQE